MRKRAVFLVLGLLLFIFCSAGLGHAAVSPRYHLLPPVNEHPWQHDGSPDPGDTLGPSPSPAVIWSIPLTAGNTLFIRVPQRIAAPGLTTKDAAIVPDDKRRFEGR